MIKARHPSLYFVSVSIVLNHSLLQPRWNPGKTELINNMITKKDGGNYPKEKE
jgi:hypothetical protein